VRRGKALADREQLVHEFRFKLTGYRGLATKPPREAERILAETLARYEADPDYWRDLAQTRHFRREAEARLRLLEALPSMPAIRGIA
jgi:predicted Zn-dependent protease